jgi:hypothetical protein
MFKIGADPWTYIKDYYNTYYLKIDLGSFVLKGEVVEMEKLVINYIPFICILFL